MASLKIDDPAKINKFKMLSSFFLGVSVTLVLIEGFQLFLDLAVPSVDGPWTVHLGQVSLVAMLLVMVWTNALAIKKGQPQWALLALLPVLFFGAVAL